MSERARIQQNTGDSASNRPGLTTRLPERQPAWSPAPCTANGGITVDVLLKRIHALPSIPPKTALLLKLIGKEGVAAREIVDVLSQDQKMTARAIEIANAPCCQLPRRVEGMRDMVLMVGSEALRHIILVTALQNILFRDVPSYGLTAEEFWSHSLACGIGAQIIAAQTRRIDPLDAFLAGLLHDTGKVILDAELLKATSTLEAYTTAAKCAYADAEQAMVGFDHADVGGRIARYWQLPPSVAQAITYHHRPVLNRITIPLAGIVHIAETLCHLLGVGCGNEGLQCRFDTQTLIDLKINSADIDNALSQMAAAISASRPFFDMPSALARISTAAR